VPNEPTGGGTVLPDCLFALHEGGRRRFSSYRPSVRRGEGVVKVVNFPFRPTIPLISSWNIWRGQKALMLWSRQNPRGIPSFDDYGYLAAPSACGRLACTTPELLHRGHQARQHSFARQRLDPSLIDFGANAWTEPRDRPSPSLRYSRKVMRQLSKSTGSQQGPFSDIYALGADCLQINRRSPASILFTRNQANHTR